MRASATSFRYRYKLVSLFAVVALTLGLTPALGAQPAAVAEEAGGGAAAGGEPLAGLLSSEAEGAAQLHADGFDDAGQGLAEGTAEEISPVAASQLSREVALQPLAEGEGVPLVADALAGKPTCFVDQEVSLDGSAPVLGSFTVDGMTYAVTGEGAVELVAVGPAALAGDPAEGSSAGLSGADGEDRGIGSGVPTSPQPQPSPSAEASTQGEHADDLAADGTAPSGEVDAEGSEAEGAKEPTALALPGSVEYGGATYSVTSIGPRALAGCDADVVRIPASVASVDEAAFRGSSVGSVEVAEGNPNLSSYEGVLYDADFSDLLLIPEGKKGVVRIHSNTSAITPEAFSHCASVTSVEVDAGNESFYVEDGALRDADGSIRWERSIGALPPSASFATQAVSNADAVFTIYFEYENRCTAVHIITTHPDNVSKTRWDGNRLIVEYSTIAAGEQVRPSSTDSMIRVASFGTSPSGTGYGPTSYYKITSADVQRGSVTLYVKTAQPSYSVTINPNGGTVSGGTAAQLNYGYLIPPSVHTRVTRYGYELCGFWSTADESGRFFGLTGHWNDDFWTDPSVKTIYADWIPYSYWLEIDTRNGNGVTSFGYIDFDEMPEPLTGFWDDLLKNPGHDLVGIFSRAEGGTKYFDGEGKPTRVWDGGEDVNDNQPRLYAQWKASKYKVSFNANGGSGGQSAQVTATYGSAMPAISTTKPTRTGYTFGGWYDTSAASGGTQYYTAAGASACAWNKTGNATLYARWTPNSYTVEYWNKAGTTKLSSDSGFKYDTSRALAAKPTSGVSAGHTAVGWAESANQTASKYGFGSSQKNLAASGTKRLYLAEIANKYTVTFNANGGSGGQAGTKTATYGSAMPGISTTKPTRTGYAFGGWYDTSAASGGTRYYTEAGASARTWNKTSNATLYARWTANRYTVSFNANGGSGGQNAQVTATYGSAMPGISTAKPTRTGYTFQGWYDTSAASGGTRYYTADGASARTWNKTSNAALYARWTAITYSVRYFDKAGNHIGTDQKAYDAWFNLRGDPGRTHPAYTAKGWARSANQTSASHAFALWTHNLASAQGATFDLYLAEEANRYSISYDLAGGELSGQPTGYTFETPDLRLPEPARTGYTFTGWKVTGAAAGSAGIAVDGVRSTVKQGTWGDLSCTATWRANQYAVALDAAFPAFAMGDVYEGYAPYGVSKDAGTASVTATFDAAMPAATMPHATGYAFEGYFDDAGTKYYDADGSSARTWDKPSGATLRARWTLERHELTLDVGNGEVPSAAGRGWKRDTGDSGLYRLSYSIEWVEESGGSLRIQLPAPATKPGYASFDGWTGGGLSKPSKSVQVQPWELADRDYVGAFSSPVGYSATLDLAGGSFADAPDGWSEAGGSWARGFTVESDAFDLPVPSRAGHDFSGWALVAPDGSLGSPAASVTVPKGTVGDRSYRAVWQARSYSITWDYSGQSIDGQQSATSSQAYGQPIAFPSKPSVADPAREHYEFAGWFTECEGGERVEAGDYLVESDATFYARWRPVEYTVHLHLGDDDAYAQHPAHIEQGGQALPLAPDGHFDLPYTVEDEVRLPAVTDDPAVPKPVREGMSFVGWVGCAADGVTHPGLVPEPDLVLPAGSHGDRHYRAVWFFALRFEVPSAVGFRFDLADDPAFEHAPHGPVHVVSGDGVEMRSLSLGQLAVADVAVDVAGADPDAIVSDRSKVQLRVMDASLPDPWTGWVPLPTTSAPERVDPYDLGALGFGDGNALAPLASKPLRYDIEVQDPVTTLAGEVDASLARIVFTVKGLW